LITEIPENNKQSTWNPWSRTISIEQQKTRLIVDKGKPNTSNWRDKHGQEIKKGNQAFHKGNKKEKGSREKKEDLLLFS
jgi:hypothetical protein